MYGIILWLTLLLLGALLATVLIILFKGPMAALLTSNSYLTPARRFYVRSLILVLVLGALAPLVGQKPLDRVFSETGEPIVGMWWLLEKLDVSIWSVTVYLVVFVILMTVLFSALGRYREQ
jgi:hypothetical protein